jgi:hypothetical protein
MYTFGFKRQTSRVFSFTHTFESSHSVETDDLRPWEVPMVNANLWQAYKREGLHAMQTTWKHLHITKKFCKIADRVYVGTQILQTIKCKWYSYIKKKFEQNKGNLEQTTLSWT